MYMEELEKQASNSAGGGGDANVKPDGDITDIVRPELVNVKTG